MNLARILELTLHGGRCPRTGVIVDTEHGTAFTDYAALHAAYRERAAACIRLALEQNFRAYAHQAEFLPFPFLSALTEGCLDAGRDVMDGGAVHNPAGVNLFGVANVADALAALRCLVFDEQAVVLDDLRHALASDFAGREDLRAAQRHPDQYRHVMVRVFGFSSQFVSLDPALQELVIANTRHRA